MQGRAGAKPPRGKEPLSWPLEVIIHPVLALKAEMQFYPLLYLQIPEQPHNRILINVEMSAGQVGRALDSAVLGYQAHRQVQSHCELMLPHAERRA